MKEFKYGAGLSIKESDREFSIMINGGSFTIRIPLPLQRAGIIGDISAVMGGANINSFPDGDYNYIRKIVTLNSVITKHPDWWEGADKCPDEFLIEKLWSHFKSSEKDFREFLKKNTGKEKPDKSSNDD